MKKIFLTLVLSGLFTVFGFTQGDCFNTATNIGTCGYFYGGNNGPFGACPGLMCGCVGGSSNPSNIDNDCSTVYSGGNCGSDFQGSIENSMFWYFSPTESCDWQLCITAENCSKGGPNPYMQIWIGQRDTTTGLVSNYIVNDNNNSSMCCGSTICYTFSVDISLGDLVVMADGNAGSECDINLDLNQINCTDTCPIVIDTVVLKLIEFDNTNISISSEEEIKIHPILQKRYSLDGREVKKSEMKLGSIYVYLYSDGTSEKIIYSKDYMDMDDE
jgi:hypothetical protein